MAKEALESKMSSLSLSCLVDKVRAAHAHHSLLAHGRTLFPTRISHRLCMRFLPVHDQPERRARLLQHDAEREVVGDDAEQAGGQETAATHQLRRVRRRCLVRGRGGQQQEAAAGAAGRRRPMRSTAGTRPFFSPVVLCLCRLPRAGTSLLHQIQKCSFFVLFSSSRFDLSVV